MNKQKQIEEMANLIHHTEFVDISGYEEEKIAEELLKYYQPKLPGNAVVLTREEYEKLKLFEERVRSGVCFTQKEWFDYCQKDSNERTSLLIKAKKDTRKETAEKFAAQMKVLLSSNTYFVLADKERLHKVIDEIAKEMEAIYAKYD